MTGHRHFHPRHDVFLALSVSFVASTSLTCLVQGRHELLSAVTFAIVQLEGFLIILYNRMPKIPLTSRLMRVATGCEGRQYLTQQPLFPAAAATHPSSK